MELSHWGKEKEKERKMFTWHNNEILQEENQQNEKKKIKEHNKVQMVELSVTSATVLQQVW